MRAVVLFVVVLLLYVNGYTQSDFSHLNTRHGLTQNDINFIYQDTKGFMWFGTVDGLNRYDGIKFKHYQISTPMQHPLGSNLPFCMVEDKNGDFWIGTSDKGLWFFDRKNEAFYQFPSSHNGKDLIFRKKIGNLFLDSNGYLWVGAAGGMSVIDTKAYSNHQYEGRVYSAGDVKINSNRGEWYQSVNYVYQDSKKDIWICTSAGLFKAELSNDWQLTLKKQLSSMWGGCNQIQEVKDGYLASYGAGLFYFTDFDQQPHKVGGYYSTNFIITSQGYVFSSNDFGLYQYEWSSEGDWLNLIQQYQYDFSNPRSLSKNIVRGLWEDRSGLLWIGTNGGGLNKLDLSKKKFRHVYQTSDPNSLGYDKIRSILEDRQNNLWLGTEGGGITCLIAEKRDRYFDGFIQKSVAGATGGQNNVYALSVIPGVKDKVLFGAGFPLKLGMASLQNGEIKLETFADKVGGLVFSIFVDRTGFIWLGTYDHGLYKCAFNADKNTLEVLYQYKADKSREGSLSSNVIRSIIEDANGNILIGTDNGLNYLRASEKSAPYPYFLVTQHVKGDTTSLAHNYILDLFLDKDKRVWVGTMGGGLCQLEDVRDSKFIFKRFSKLGDFPNGVIKGIEQDNSGNLWISSNRGISRFNPYSRELRNYSISDGLQDYEFSELASYKAKDGKMYFGGVNGFNVFDPEEIKDNPYASQVEFTSLRILNDDIGPGKVYNGRVVLDHEMPSMDHLKFRFAENSFTIGFSAFHFAAPEKIRYKYMLEGFDVGWVLVKENEEPTAKYTNIPPGDYVLKVLATNNDGIWNTVPSTINIEVVPPFWLTIWAFMLYGLIILILLLFFKKYSVIRVTQKNELMMEHFEQQKIEELVQMKLQFFTNISHEFRTPLTLIQSPLEKLISKGSEVDEEFRQRSYSLMIKNIAILNRLISQLMDFRKLEKGKMPLEVTRGNFSELVAEVFEAFNEIASNKNIRFELRNTYSSIELWYDYDKMEKVLYNIVSNAFKFTPQGGEVGILVDEVERDGAEWVKVDVLNSGPGIDKEKIPYLFQRFYQAASHKLSKVSGTGIGLAFAKNLVTLHHGDIEVKSEPNVETVFTVFLKKGKVHFNTEDFSKQTPDNQIGKIKVLKDYQDGAARTNGLGEQVELNIDKDKQVVLVVEDNHDVQSLLKDNLEENYNCIQAYNGVEGLELCRKYSPDLIISDVMMPEMDGYEMCSEIKKDNTVCHIPVVMLTARSTDVDKMSGFEGGAEAYISKPFNVDLLMAQVKSILEARNVVKDRFSKNLSIEPEEVTFTSIDEKLIEKLLKIVEVNIGNPEFTVVQMADEVGMSQSILNKKLKALLGQTANVFIRSIRLKRAAQLLKLQRLAVMDVVYEVGFNDVKYFRECFRKQFDMTPTEYARQYKEEGDQ